MLSTAQPEGGGDEVTELESLRARLRMCEQQLAISMDHAPIGMSVVDNDDRMVRVNEALCRFLGYSEADLLGRTWKELTYPADQAVGATEIAALFAGERSTLALEKRYLRADGQPVWAQVNVALIRDERGEPLFRVTQQVDISERKEREQHLQWVADAERAVADELRHLDDIKNNFLDAVSHELRTPLTVIRGIAETLQHRRAELDAADRIRLEDAIASQAHNLSDLIEGLMELQRLSHGEGMLEPGPVEAVDAIRHVLEGSAVASRAHLSAPAELVVRTDRHRLDLIVRNLLGNVAKYAPVGPVTIAAAPLSGGGVRLDVSDHGPGIPVNDRKAVFKAFHRVALHHPTPGTGIGLSLVARFAELHGGQAWVEDSEVGAHIVVTLPDLPSAAETPATTAVADRVPRQVPR